MPNKALEAYRVPREVGKDKRVKLTPLQREEIRRNEDNLSQRELAQQYSVSRRLITFILHPEKHEENLRRREERGGTMAYYDKKKHRQYVKKHREHKKELMNDDN